MVFSYVDVAAFLGLYVFVHWQTTSASRNNYKWYARGSNAIRAKGGYAPPGWLFGIAWWILYKLITVSLFIFFRESPNTSWTYLAVFVTATTNVLLNKVWSQLFWDWKRTGWSLAVAVLMLISSIVVLVFVALTPGNALWGLTFGLYTPYAVWLLVAIYLNGWWYRLDLPTSTAIRGRAVAAAATKKKKTRNGRVYKLTAGGGV
jgi:tryptophan-rich sensory protein